jgi:restriction endonuclease S subunit
MGKPKIRFKGYEDDWEQRKLKDYLEVSREKNKTESYGKEDVLSVSGEHGIVNQIEFQGRSFAGVSVANYGVVEAGDVVYTKSPLKSNPYGIIKTNKGKTGIVSTLYAVYKPRMNTNSEFVQIYFELDSRMNSYMHPLVNKGAKNDMKVSDENALKGPVAFPELEEQNAITQYFDKLDRLITLHQRKCEETKSLKKYMLQKMFPENGNCVPKIRFSGFADAWEQRKWIDVVDISTEMVNPTTGEYDNMPHIAPGNIESFTGRILDNVKTVKEEQLISGKFRFRPDDVVYGKINPQLGKYFYATVNGLTSADAYVFNGKNGLKQKFLFALLQTSDFFKYSVSVSKRSGMPKINRDELNAYSFLMPSEEEQDRIGSYLLQLDHLITLHQHKCDELQKLKKFMLQNMFV